MPVHTETRRDGSRDCFILGRKVDPEVYEAYLELRERYEAAKAALNEAHPFGVPAGPLTPYPFLVPTWPRFTRLAAVPERQPS